MSVETKEEETARKESENVHTRILRASELIGAVAKTEKQAQQGWFFRGIDAFQIALHPALIKAGITITQKLESWEETPVTNRNGNTEFKALVTVAYTITSSADKSSTTETYIGCAVDQRDKHFAKATTDAYKNMARFTFHIPIGLPDDTETNVEPVTPTTPVVELITKAQVDEIAAVFMGIDDEARRKSDQAMFKTVFGSPSRIKPARFKEAIETAEIMVQNWERETETN